jgi:hypothetical protein
MITATTTGIVLAVIELVAKYGPTMAQGLYLLWTQENEATEVTPDMIAKLKAMKPPESFFTEG